MNIIYIIFELKFTRTCANQAERARASANARERRSTQTTNANANAMECSMQVLSINAHTICTINEVTLKPTQLSGNATIVATTVASAAETVAAIIFPSQISEIIKILFALGELFNNCVQT